MSEGLEFKILMISKFSWICFIPAGIVETSNNDVCENKTVKDPGKDQQ